MTRGTIIAESVPSLSAKVNNITSLSFPLNSERFRERRGWVEILLLLILTAFIFSTSTTFAFKLPDTGQTKCYDKAGSDTSCMTAGRGVEK